ncbi:MAG: cell division protein FtsZ [Flavobacteriales bacterium]|nr:cell division protein FtsZ [Flavobacteriales bacterium]
MKFEMPNNQNTIIKVIGIGGGGSNAVNHMFKQGINGVDFIICNTDQQALDISPIPTKIRLGGTLTKGLGAGANPEVGKNSAIESIEEIKNFLGNETKMIFITAGMGGGTGTGAAPIIAQAAREMGILTVGIVTIPFTFEGRRRKIQGEEGLESLRQNVDTLLVVCNDRLREMYGNLKMSEAFAKADDILSVAAKSIAEIITVTGYINVDFEDVRTVMKDSGTALMGSAVAEGDDRAIKAVSQALSSPLLNDNDITGANYILLYITSGESEITMDEISEITDYIQNETGNTADIIWGNGSDLSLGSKIGVTIIATGFGKKEVLGYTTTQETKKVVRNLSDDVPTSITQPLTDFTENTKSTSENINETSTETEPFLKKQTESSTFNFKEENITEPPTNTPSNEEKSNVVIFSLDDDTDEINKKREETLFKEETQPSLNEKPEEIKPVQTPVYTTKLPDEEQQKRAQERILRIKAFSLKLKSPSGLNDMEKEPAYKRKQISLNDIPHSSESDISRYTLSDENNEEKKTLLRPNNPFIHDAVD